VRANLHNLVLHDILELMTHVVVCRIQNSEKSGNSNGILSVNHSEEFLVMETLFLQEAGITLNLRRALDLHLGAILKHLPTHFSDSTLSILLQLNKGRNNVVLKLANELFGGISHWVNISHFSE